MELQKNMERLMIEAGEKIKKEKEERNVESEENRKEMENDRGREEREKKEVVVRKVIQRIIFQLWGR